MSYITGLGIATAAFPDIASLLDVDFAARAPLAPAERPGDYVRANLPFPLVQRMAREDRSLLNPGSRLALQVAAEAFDAASAGRPYTDEERERFAVFTGVEGEDATMAVLTPLHARHGLDGCGYFGEVKADLNPLDMLRLLTTNALYQISKLFALRGEGYPLQRMSLTSLCALEEAHRQIEGGAIDRAVIAAVGDMTSADNVAAFEKMGLLRTTSHPVGIVPAFGAVGVVVERTPRDGCTPCAQVLDVHSLYKPDTSVSSADWSRLFARFPGEAALGVPHVVLYQNGEPSLGKAERNAVQHAWPNAVVHAYKPHVGYTGRANNLIDLVLAIADPAIPVGAPVLVNGIGVSSGLGAILVRKLSGVGR
ncbi:beta-ketoacyl synthase [Burkholderia contaminans]|uniref:beta-ketoacyl synthase N-terminal-like domain-containing protein n=1 Tax=Burkholderia contaminans TaxID=488447 RepID=UPI001CF5EF5C|nr:beta-ketoacyl synthase N-terminal-like domain-containing protein [Burkholderia contaminans]MCA7920535.1 beta-ketoacyl synthase [Burkholderia contaminans]UUX42401.1 beta-ketoacyl synthase [Burkholderia contaminans]